MCRLLVIVLTLVFFAPIAADTLAPEANAQRAVLVTGASTGIGRKITEHLAADGHFVYAGARKESDLLALGAIKNVQAVRLDVTNAQDIAAAVDTVVKGGRPRPQLSSAACCERPRSSLLNCRLVLGDNSDAVYRLQRK